MSDKIVQLTSENFEQEVLKSEMPVLVDFWAPWCNPCVMMGKILDEIVNEVAGKIKIAKLNVDEATNQDLAKRYGIQGIPALKIFNNGQVIKEMVGMQSKEELLAEIAGSL
ncbi:thioredoxin [Candidatus Falkowbacteria bacterium]|nr:thioredoxin [Candidatus Falkowbacteria bacterium]